MFYKFVRGGERWALRADLGGDFGRLGAVELALMAGPLTKEDSVCVSRCEMSCSRCALICVGMEVRYFSIRLASISSSLPAQVDRIVEMPAIFSGMPIAI